MIYESKYWKDTLLKKSISLNKKMRQKRWPEASIAILEQDIMIGFYIIRKLIESYKIDTAFKNKQIHLCSYKLIGGHSTMWKRWEFHELYDINNPTKETMKLLDICNQIIHSYHFFPAWSPNLALEGVYFNSDRLRQDRLLHLQLTSIIDIFDEIGNNYPNYSCSSGPLGHPDTVWIQETRNLEDMESME